MSAADVLPHDAPDTEALRVRGVARLLLLTTALVVGGLLGAVWALAS